MPASPLVDSSLDTCPACGRAIPARIPDRCWCGLELPQPARYRATETGGAPVAADELGAFEVEQVALVPPACPTVGAWVRGECILIHGPAGSGKSRLAYRWASAEPALLVSLEMPAKRAAQTARSAGARLEHLTITESPDWRAAIGRRRVLVVDSVSELRRGALEYSRAVHDWCESTGGLAFLIAAETDGGTPRGGTELPHEVDAVLHVTRYPHEPTRARVAWSKRRLAPPGEPAGVAL